MIFLELISKTILNKKKMKTISKFSVLLLLMTAVLLCSYVLMEKRSTHDQKAINSVAAGGTPVETLKS